MTSRRVAVAALLGALGLLAAGCTPGSENAAAPPPTERAVQTGIAALDVVQANNGRADMGAFVAAGELLPLAPWAQAYGWDQRSPDAVRQYVSYTPDGKTFGEGEVYGLPQVGEVVG